MNTSRFPLALAGIVTLSVVAGLWSAGGPGLARADKFDSIRINSLKAIAAILTCKRENEAHRPLPDHLDLMSLGDRCSRVIQQTDLVDRETLLPHRYTRTGDKTFEVCARFADAQRAKDRYAPDSSAACTFDADSGCMKGRLY